MDIGFLLTRRTVKWTKWGLKYLKNEGNMPDYFRVIARVIPIISSQNFMKKYRTFLKKYRKILKMCALLPPTPPP